VIFNIWRLTRPEDGLSEDEASGRPPTESGAIPIGPVALPTQKVTTCACGKEGKHYSELAIDTVIPAAPERIYNLMFASRSLKDFMHEKQKLEGKFCFFFSPSVSHEEYLHRYSDI
jgi:hypothetical protein